MAALFGAPLLLLNQRDISDEPMDMDELEKMMEALKNGEEFDDSIFESLPNPHAIPEEPPIFRLARQRELSFREFQEACGDHLKVEHIGKNLLFPAVASGSLEKVQWLIEMGIDPCQADENGYTPVTTASFLHRDDDVIFDYFCQLKANLDSESSYGESALSCSIRTGRYDRVRSLIEHGADPSIASFSSLHQAAASGDHSRIQIETNPKTLESKDRWERTPWLTALCADQVEAAQLLENLGANIEVIDHVGDEAIHLAAQCDAPKALAYLISKGIAIGKPGHFKQTALHAAAEYDSFSCTKLLLDSGAQIDPLNETEAQPISLARSLEMIQLLHEAGASLNFVCGAGEWPLRDFADDGDIEGLRWMLENGADPNLTSTGETALFNAIRSDELEAAALLIEFGADVNAQDVDGESLFFRCASTRAVDFLIANNADTKIQEMTGCGPAQASWVDQKIRDYMKSTGKF